MQDPVEPSRRPLKTRQRRWARELAARLARRGVAPDTVSIASVLFAALAGLAFSLSVEGDGGTCVLCLLAAAAGIQLRLLCNMVDGLIAVEGGRASPAGEVYNDLPDRIADAFVFVGAGIALRRIPGGVTLGWLAALLAFLTAYVRVLGGSLGLQQSFAGPMAKQHRMFVMTVACVTAAVEAAVSRSPRTLYAALVLVVAGSAYTAAARTRAIVRDLRRR
ncbi:MAG: CDP-alcohol phosphatidyltransferase family protein [Thermoanaerobaculia bacterium]